MTTRDRLPAILQAMQDAAHEASDLVLAAGIANAVDLAELAPLLPLTGADEANGRGLHAVVAGDASRYVDTHSLAAADRALAARAAARLASTACLLLAVDARGHEETAMRLWVAAGRLIGIRPAAEEDDPIAAKQRAHAPGGLQVGDIVNAIDVPRRTLVECPDKTLVIRLPNGKGQAIGRCDNLGAGWTWESEVALLDAPRMRILALDIPAEKCFAVAGMTPTEAREWLAQRVAAEPVR